MAPLLRASVALHGAAAAAALAVPAAWPWAAGAVLANHLGLVAAGLWPRSRGLGPNVSRLPAQAAARGEVAITIDDGPDPEVTPAVLDLLAAAGVAATFFCIAERARARPALLRRIVAAGHSVQNHSLRHRHHFSLLGPRALAREIGGAQALLADLSGIAPIAFRAPAGLRNPLLDPVLHRLGLHLVSWTRRGFDTRQTRPQAVLARLAGERSRGLAGGDILLLHDGHAARTAAGRPVLLEVLPPLLARLRAAGLQPVTLAAALPPRCA
ncbi:MAG: polysaccharide deacetylase family protein [Burkholderiales bacterium]|nr:polysaccharide deacetylase family protein [Burkholderiales bacterium]